MSIGKTILYVDDSQFMLKAYKEELTKFGLKVETLEKPEKIFEFLNQMKSLPDCIITDYEMPVVDGPELARQIKKNPKTSLIPVVLLTANDNKDHLLRAINSGADDFISKSTDSEILVYKIHAAVRQVSMIKKQLELERYRTAHALITTYNHEINNPLSIAFGMLGDSLDDFDQQRFDKCFDSLERVAEIVRKIDGLIDVNIDFEGYVSDSELVKLKK